MNKYRVLQIAIPDLAIVYGGVRGRTLSSRHLAHARNALALAGISQVIDLRQDYTSDRYKDICEANGMKYFHYPEYDDGIEYGYDWFSTEFIYDIMKTIHLLRTNREHADIIVNDYSKYIKR